MTKLVMLQGDIKHAARLQDRHQLPRPSTHSTLWVRSLTTLRVADLFRTEQGLFGHWLQIQEQINGTNRHFFDRDGHTTGEGKALIRWIADAVIHAAQAARFDFPLMTLRFTEDMAGSSYTVPAEPS